MLHAEPHEGRQGAVVHGDGAFHLDLAERDEQALLELGVEAKQPRGPPEVAAGGGERVHGVEQRIRKDHERPAAEKAHLSSSADRNSKRTRRERDPGELKTAKRRRKQAAAARFLREPRRKGLVWRSEARTAGRWY